ncbi:unnamed protein product [Boreogadus saida]
MERRLRGAAASTRVSQRGQRRGGRIRVIAGWSFSLEFSCWVQRLLFNVRETGQDAFNTEHIDRHPITSAS